MATRQRVDGRARSWTRCLGFGLLFFSAWVHGHTDGPDEITTLDPVSVTARLIGATAFDLPASINTVRFDPEASKTNVNISEYLNGIPGVLVRDRQNYAQDTQLSIRGFGARATFGVRGIRLYSDGIPATMPDGQGQVSHFNLLAGDRIEVLRGPFSALYGNSSGGVIQLWSADGTQPGEWRFQGTAGRYDTYTAGARLLGATDRTDYNLTASLFNTRGYRDHSAALRRSANLKVNLATYDQGQLSLALNAFDTPRAQDPLGLTREQARDDPRQASPAALQFNTRKQIRQNQVGLRWKQPLGAGHTLDTMAYGGSRAMRQFLSVPVAVQRNPLHAGGISDLHNRYQGVDLRWSWLGEIAARPFEITIGTNFDRQRQHRQGYENHIGSTLGVVGRLRRNERNRIENFDQFAQAWWHVTPRWSLLAGVRHSEVKFQSRDAYITTDNPDDSGHVTYSETTPVAGINFAANEQWRLYLSAGRGFETPTFNELSYRVDGGAGLAFNLLPAVSRNYELGMKWRNRDDAAFEAALFRIDTDDELAVAQSSGGRASYRNVGRSRRQGIELSTTGRWAMQWSYTLSYTYLDAQFRDALLTADGTLARRARTRISGTARHEFFSRVQWRAAQWTVAMEGQGLSNVIANDRGTERAAGFFLIHLEAARAWPTTLGQWRGFVRVDNVFDRAYIGSIIVNESNQRYYEPGPDRTYVVGLQWNGPPR